MNFLRSLPILVLTTNLFICFSDKSTRTYAQESISEPLKQEQIWQKGVQLSQEAGKLEQESLADALDKFLQAEKIFEQSNTIDWQAYVLNRIGKLHQIRGEYELALTSYQKSVKIYRDLQDFKNEPIILSKIASVYRNQGKYHQALTTYREARAKFEKTGATSTKIASIYHDEAVVYHNLGRHEKAEIGYQKSIEVFQKEENKLDLGVIWNNIGKIREQRKEYNTALDAYDTALSFFQGKENIDARQLTARTLTYQGNVHRHLKEFEEAIATLRTSLEMRKELGDRPGEGVTLARLATAYRDLGNYRLAMERYRQALEIFEDVGDRLEIARTLTDVGATYLEQKKWNLAKHELKKAIATFDTLCSDLGDSTTKPHSIKPFDRDTDENKIAFLDTQARTYQLLQKALVRQNKQEEALEVSEQARTRAFADLLAERLGSRIGEVRVPCDSPKLDEIRNAAKEKQATFVEYSFIEEDEEMYIWTIEPEGKIHFRAVDLKKELPEGLNAKIDEIRQGLTQDSRALEHFWQERSSDRFKQMYRVLIEPIEDLLPENPEDEVIFIPQGFLFLLPFAALQDAEGKYLIEKHTLTVASSIRVLELQRHGAAWNARRMRGKRRRPTVVGTPSSVAVVGNPVMPEIPRDLGEEPRSLPSLVGAEEEAIAIARYLGAKPLVGSEATKKAVLEKMQSARIIHLATHGLLDDLGTGVPGAIALAPNKGESAGEDESNGLLMAYDVLTMRLQAELVVLSACDSGLGKVTGDGIVGLSRAFAAAGVPSLVVSLWKVPDRPTKEMMVEFYQQLGRGLRQEPNKARALRRAMLEMKEKYDNPKDWAAFVLVGES